MTNTAQLRPKYKIDTEITPEKLVSKFKNLLINNDLVEGKIVDNYIYLKIPEKDQHYWSPEMRISIKESAMGSLVTGIVGPNGKVWATFLVFYGLAIMLLIFGGSLGISQLMLGLESYWIWSIPVSVILYLIIIMAAKYGQRLGNDQHLRLRYFFDEAVVDAESK